jgi:hypothetical protein
MNGGTAAFDRRGHAQIGVALERLATNFRISITCGIQLAGCESPCDELIRGDGPSWLCVRHGEAAFEPSQEIRRSGGVHRRRIRRDLYRELNLTGGQEFRRSFRGDQELIA